MASHLVETLREDKYKHFPCYNIQTGRDNRRIPTYMGVILKTGYIDKSWFDRRYWYGDSDTAVIVQGAGSGLPLLILTKEEASILVDCFDSFLGGDERRTRGEKLNKNHTVDYFHGDGTRGVIAIGYCNGVAKESLEGPNRIVTFYKKWPSNVRSAMLYEAYAEKMVETIRDIVEK